MTEDVEKLSRRRRVILATYGIAFLAFQGIAFQSLDQPVEQWRPVDWAKAAAFIGWSATLIFIFTTGGLLFRGRTASARAALNDELTYANRDAGYRAGFWAMLIVLFVLFVLGQVFELNRNEVLRLTFAIGVAMPACRFAGLERRQGA